MYYRIVREENEPTIDINDVEAFDNGFWIRCNPDMTHFYILTEISLSENSYFIWIEISTGFNNGKYYPYFKHAIESAMVDWVVYFFETKYDTEDFIKRML